MLLLFSEIGWGPGTAVILFMLLTWYHVTFDIFGVWTVYMFNFKLLPQMEQERRSLLLQEKYIVKRSISCLTLQLNVP